MSFLKNNIKKYLKRRNSSHFDNSIVYWNVLFDSETFLEGKNVIYNGCDIRGTSIGLCSYLGINCNITKSSIGRFCSIASGVRVQPYTHPIDFCSTYPGFYDAKNELPFGHANTKFNEFIGCDNGFAVNIGNDVWIGDNVTIKGGVTIGDGAVIGMNTVVTKDVPPYSIVVGVPGRIIKYRFDDEIISKLLKIRWWNWSIDFIEKHKNDFSDVEKIIDLSIEFNK